MITKIKYDNTKHRPVSETTDELARELAGVGHGDLGRVLGKGERESLARTMLLSRAGRIDGYGYTVGWTTSERVTECWVET